MANMYKIPSPTALVKPPAGPPVPNMGGIPKQGMAPQRPNFAQVPSIRTGPPGPAPAAVPPALPAAPVAPAAVPASNTLPTPPGGAAAPVFNFNFAQGGASALPSPETPPVVGPPTSPQRGELWPDRPEAGPEASYKPVRQINYVPRRFEVDSLQPGEGAETPIGPVYRDTTTGRLKVRLNEQGKMAWRQKEQARLKEFGVYPRSTDPLAPRPDVTPGQPVYDAFRGRWL